MTSAPAKSFAKAKYPKHVNYRDRLPGHERECRGLHEYHVRHGNGFYYVAIACGCGSERKTLRRKYRTFDEANQEADVRNGKTTQTQEPAMDTSLTSRDNYRSHQR